MFPVPPNPKLFCAATVWATQLKRYEAIVCSLHYEAIRFSLYYKHFVGSLPTKPYEEIVCNNCFYATNKLFVIQTKSFVIPAKIASYYYAAVFFVIITNSCLFVSF